MKTIQVRTLCECEATLIAVLDQQLNVIGGATEDSRRRQLPVCHSANLQPHGATVR
jgi:hypothetical protein